MDVKGDGLVVQHIKKIDGRVVPSFRDVASRDKAQERIDKNPSQNLFHSVCFPCRCNSLLLFGFRTLKMFKFSKVLTKKVQEKVRSIISWSES